MEILLRYTGINKIDGFINLGDNLATHQWNKVPFVYIVRKLVAQSGKLVVRLWNLVSSEEERVLGLNPTWMDQKAVSGNLKGYLTIGVRSALIG